MPISFPLSPARLAIWLVSFFSPTIYFVLLLVAEQLALNPLSEKIIIFLFCLIPLAALLICEFLVWQASRDGTRRSGWMWFTMLGLVFQFGVIIAIVLMATRYVGYFPAG
ncbi:MAG: hypothetical protein AAF649_06510 [Verrucomicrobiota bacterium]